MTQAFASDINDYQSAHLCAIDERDEAAVVGAELSKDAQGKDAMITYLYRLLVVFPGHPLANSIWLCRRRCHKIKGLHSPRPRTGTGQPQTQLDRYQVCI